MLVQAASDAVIVTVRRPLTWANAVTWPVLAGSALISHQGGQGFKSPQLHARKPPGQSVVLALVRSREDRLTVI